MYNIYLYFCTILILEYHKTNLPLCANVIFQAPPLPKVSDIEETFSLAVRKLGGGGRPNLKVYRFIFVHLYKKVEKGVATFVVNKIRSGIFYEQTKINTRLIFVNTDVFLRGLRYPALYLCHLVLG